MSGAAFQARLSATCSRPRPCSSSRSCANPSPGETRALDSLGIDREIGAHLATLAAGTEVCALTIGSAV